MSRASKLTLMGTSLFALATVVLVHYQQEAEQAVRRLPRPASQHPNQSTKTSALLTRPPVYTHNRQCTKA